MIKISDIQAAFISELKTSSSITPVTQDEVREYLWKGTNFVYPNIRVKMGMLVPVAKSPNCKVFTAFVIVEVYSEEKSSKQANDIAGAIADSFWGRAFTSNGVKFSGINVDSIEAADIPEGDVNSWRSAVNFSATVS